MRHKENIFHPSPHDSEVDGGKLPVWADTHHTLLRKPQPQRLKAANVRNCPDRRGGTIFEDGKLSTSVGSLVE